MLAEASQDTRLVHSPGPILETAGADGVDIKSQIDWTKLGLRMSTETGASTAGVVFTVADITSASCHDK